jgi:hypothetical protein
MYKKLCEELVSCFPFVKRDEPRKGRTQFFYSCVYSLIGLTFLPNTLD